MTSRRLVALASLLVLRFSTPLYAQLLTTDPVNTAEVAAAVDQVLRVVENAVKVVEWYERAQTALSGITRYRTVPIAAVWHDTDRFKYGGDFLGIYNNGDARGERYMRNVRKVAEYAALLEHLPPDQRARMAQKIAMREVADSIGQRGGHVIGQVRQNGATVASVLREIEDAIMNPRTAMHFQTAILEKGNALSLANAKQIETQNIELSHILEHRTFQTKRQSDAMTSVINQQLNNLSQAPAYAASAITGTSDAIRNKRLF